MSAETKSLKDANGKIAPQHYDESLEEWDFTKGEGGALYTKLVDSVALKGSIAMESWEESVSSTKTFPTPRYGFSIVNDGTEDVTFTINEQTRRVKQDENYSAIFEAFTEVVIVASTLYRAEVLR